MSEPVWLRPVPASPTTGRPAELSREQIVAAARVVADHDGLAAVTTRRVARELGTGSASLYRHVTTRNDIVDLMVDQALGEYEPPARVGDWRTDVVAEHMHRLRFLRRSPWVIDAILERQPLGPAPIRMLEHTLAQLAGHPAAGQTKLEAVGVLNGMIQTYLRNERPGGMLDEQLAEARTAMFVRAASDDAHPHLAALFADVATHTPESPDDQLARILGLVLDGLLPEQ